VIRCFTIRSSARSVVSASQAKIGWDTESRIKMFLFLSLAPAGSRHLIRGCLAQLVDGDGRSIQGNDLPGPSL
jgi:hypothetical protein